MTRLSKTEITGRFDVSCQKLGKTPGFALFCKTARIKKSDIEYYWPRFSDFVKECGGKPQGWIAKIPDEELFREYVKVCLHLKKLPTSNELRIATRELKTRTHTIKNLLGFDIRFKKWLETQTDESKQILAFPGWNRQGRVAKKEAKTSNTFTFYPYLPACLQNLDVLARGEMPLGEKQDQSAAILFEQRCADAFRCLGFGIEPLGQGSGRKADFLAVSFQERFALIVDVKTRQNGYVLGTEDRKFLEYSIRHGESLQSKGIERLYLVVIASEFRERDYQQLATFLTHSPIRNAVLLTAKGLIRIVEESIRERSSFDLRELEKTIFSSKVINE